MVIDIASGLMAQKAMACIVGRFGNLPPVCMKCGRDNRPDAFLCDQCGEPLKDSKCKEPCARGQMVATLVASQDNTTWLAFTLGMTTESVLLVGFFQGVFDSAHLPVHLTIPLFGILLAWVFKNMGTRSTGDLDALYARGENIAFDAFNMPNSLRRGRRAGPIMVRTLWVWGIAWAVAFVLSALAGLAGAG